MQRPPQPVVTASLGPPPLPRRELPDRNVTSLSFDDAYVAFVLFCNPGVPTDTDSAALREAFRTPPKSGGKSFSTFTLFELIKQLEARELKTWAELALKLGVEPPDQEKGQSSQKIQQYAVRLKRWMHSMHVDAFFEYLLNRPHPYWTEIPSDQTPVADLERDGVAAEDDMALRALLPQIKPRRGRKRPDDDDTNKSPSQRPSPQPDEFEPWTAHPDGRGSVFLFPVSDPSRLNAHTPMGQPPNPPWNQNNDVAQTPLTAYPHPQSAITPSTRQSFWGEEPKSAITPMKGRAANRRHGAKVVSSAWRTGATSTGGKTRGRPPINRTGHPDGPFSAFPASDMHTFKIPSPTPEINPTSQSTTDPALSRPPSVPPLVAPLAAPPQPPQLVQSPIQYTPTQENGPSRPAKRSRLSLQVPERVGGEVRLATPPLPAAPAPTPPAPPAPPVVMVNGQTHQQSLDNLVPQLGVTGHAGIVPSYNGSFAGQTAPINGTQGHPRIFFQDRSDRTNKDELEGMFMFELLTASWYDAQGNRIAPCCVDEAWGVTQTVIESLLKAATTKEAFLINLAALAGGKIMMKTGSLRVTRLEQLADRNRYYCAWELRMGDIRGSYTMEETVMHDKWRKRATPAAAAATTTKDDVDRSTTGGIDDAAATTNGNDEPMTAEYWQRKYKEMAGMLQQRDKELTLLRTKVMESIRGHAQTQ
ncbi:ARS binding protein 2-domain-containing protein [Lasiosphaeria ovina]|uniref:ARS binding protein 2-domain-containing protein n=1 Tax=Lasiosphaeria ovina TaxID=92902 RepID=A0AAE0KB45_9PEZI|nr:ARS binding protein 2-domain-containing protein [Lasiosphaeria ovina]